MQNRKSVKTKAKSKLNKKVGGAGDLPDCSRDRKVTIRGPVWDLDLGLPKFFPKLEIYLKLLEDTKSVRNFTHITGIKTLCSEISSDLRKYSGLWDCVFHEIPNDKLLGKDHLGRDFKVKSRAKLMYAEASVNKIESLFEQAINNKERFKTVKEFREEIVEEFKQLCIKVYKYLDQLDYMKIRIKQFDVSQWWRGYGVEPGDHDAKAYQIFIKRIGYISGKLTVTDKQLKEYEKVRGTEFPIWYPMNWPDWINWPAEIEEQPELKTYDKDLKRGVVEGYLTMFNTRWYESTPWRKLDQIEKSKYGKAFIDMSRKKWSKDAWVFEAQDQRYDIRTGQYGTRIYLNLKPEQQKLRRYENLIKELEKKPATLARQAKKGVYKIKIKQIEERIKNIIKPAKDKFDKSNHRTKLFSHIIKNGKDPRLINEISDKKPELTVKELEFMFQNDLTLDEYIHWTEINKNHKELKQPEMTLEQYKRNSRARPMFKLDWKEYTKSTLRKNKYKKDHADQKAAEKERNDYLSVTVPSLRKKGHDRLVGRPNIDRQEDESEKNIDLSPARVRKKTGLKGNKQVKFGPRSKPDSQKISRYVPKFVGPRTVWPGEKEYIENIKKQQSKHKSEQGQLLNTLQENSQAERQRMESERKRKEEKEATRERTNRAIDRGWPVRETEKQRIDRLYWIRRYYEIKEKKKPAHVRNLTDDDLEKYADAKRITPKDLMSFTSKMGFKGLDGNPLKFP